MSKKRLRKTYKPTAYILIGCFLMYILLSQAMAAFSRQDDIKKLENEVAAVKKEKKELENEVELLNDDDYVTSICTRKLRFYKRWWTSCHLTGYSQEK